MGFRVPVRNVQRLEHMLTLRCMELPDECKTNAAIIDNALRYADRALPSFRMITKTDQTLIAQSVAYLLRTDIIKAGGPVYGAPNFLAAPTPMTHGENAGIPLRNNPVPLAPDFRLPERYHNEAAHYFLCFSVTFDYLKDSCRILTNDDNPFTPSYSLADVAAFLIPPTVLTDYQYTDQERHAYHGLILRQMSSI